MGIAKANAKKAGGVVYTPEWLADLVIEQAPASALFSGVCADISCGEGAFLLRLCHRAWGEIARAEADGAARAERFKEWAQTKLWGSDVDKAALARARAALDGFAEGLGISGVKWRVFERDGLGERLRGELKGKCSLMAGNPPYVRIQNLSEASRAAAQKLSFCAKGSTDLYLAFYEIGLECLAPGGFLCFVAPNSWTRAKAGAAMRESLARSGKLSRLIDFRDWPPFEGVGAYCAVAVMEQAGGRSEFEYFEWDPKKKRPIRVGMAKASGLASALPMPALLARAAMGAGVELGRLCRFSVGFATLADEVFITEPMALPPAGEDPVKCRFAAGEFWIERAALRPLIKASVAKKPEALADRLVLFPYEKDQDGAPKGMSEARAKERFPLAAAYLQKCRSRLEARDRGKENAQGWMAFGRSQGLVSSFEAWAVSPMLAKEPSFCLVREAEGWGAPAFVAGLGIRFEAPTATQKKMLALLNSPAMAEFAQQAGADYRGGYKSYAKTVIERFPVDPAALGIRWLPDREGALAWLMANLPKSAQPARPPEGASAAQKREWERALLAAGKAKHKDAIAYGFKA